MLRRRRDTRCGRVAVASSPAAPRPCWRTRWSTNSSPSACTRAARTAWRTRCRWTTYWGGWRRRHSPTWPAAWRLCVLAACRTASHAARATRAVATLAPRAARVGPLYKFESHCPGPKKWTQDPRGRRGQPLQDREPLPGAEEEESRRKPAGQTPIRSGSHSAAELRSLLGTALNGLD